MPLDTQAAACDCCERWKGLIWTNFYHRMKQKGEGAVKERNILGCESNYGDRNNYWYNKERFDPQEQDSGGDKREEGEIEGKTTVGENRKTMFRLCHPPLFTPSPHLPFSPQESVHSSLLCSCFPPSPFSSSSSFSFLHLL